MALLAKGTTKRLQLRLIPEVLMRDLACQLVLLQHLGDRGRVSGRGKFKDPFDCTRYLGEGYLFLQECCHGALVGRVQRYAVVSARFGGFVGETKARESLEIGWAEVEL